jgi:hypothetical protein
VTTALSLCASAGASAAAADTPATVHIAANQAIARVQPASAGTDTPFWNPYLTDAVTVQRIRAAGIRNLDFDAGSPIDLYDWRTNTLRPDPDRARDRANGLDPTGLTPQFSFDRFESVAKAAGAQTTVHVNYGTGTPQEAAAWVTYANRIRRDHVHNWIVGEEVYLDQLIEPDRRVPKDVDWTTKREDTAVNAQRYARNVIAYSRAMKAVDPSIHIGVEMWALDPAQLATNPMAQFIHTWCQDVANTPGLANAVDFADIHWLGDFNDESGTIGPQLATTATIRPAVTDLRTMLNAHARPGHRIGIIAGEVNSASAGNSYTGTQGNAAYLADTNFTLLENGVAGVDWFALYSGLNAALPDGDLGLLSSHDCKADDNGKQVCEAPVGTPFPTYYGMQLFTTAARPGGRIVKAAPAGDVSAHAVRRPDGSLAVLLVNRNGTRTSDVRLAVDGYRARGSATQLQSIGTGITRTTTAPDSTLHLPPYSVTVVLLHH